MPDIKITDPDYQALRDRMKQGESKDKLFEVGEDVVYPDPGSSTQSWRSIAVRLEKYAVGKRTPDPGDDEPEFVVASLVDGVTELLHSPTNEKTVKEGSQIETLRAKVLTHHFLDVGAHEIAVDVAAYESDQQSAWEAVVKALGKDLSAAGHALVAGYPGDTPPAIVDLVTQGTSVLQNGPDYVGGTSTVTRERRLWLRPEGVQRWDALKFLVLSDPSAPAWYLTMWRIILDTGQISMRDRRRENGEFV